MLRALDVLPGLSLAAVLATVVAVVTRTLILLRPRGLPEMHAAPVARPWRWRSGWWTPPALLAAILALILAG